MEKANGKSSELGKSVRRDCLIVDGASLLLEEQFMSDCTFIMSSSEGKKVRIAAHRLILCCASPMFTSMLSDTWLNEEREVDLSGVSAEDFKLLLEIVYTHEPPVEMDVDSAIKVLRSAHMYIATDAVELCSGYITDSLSANNVCEVLHVATLLDLAELQSSAIEYIMKHTGEVLADPSFVYCEDTVLKQIMDQEELNIDSEIALLQACIRWGQYRVKGEGEGGGDSKDAPASVRDALGEMFYLLRLASLSVEEVAAHVSPSGLLSPTEELQLFRYLLTKSHSPLPKQFSEKIRSRYNVGGPIVEPTVGCPGAKELIEAAQNGNMNLVEILLEDEIPVDAREELESETALHVAASKGYVDMARLLLESGADLHATCGNFASTPLHLAAERGRSSVVLEMLQRGANVHATETDGSTPLHSAVRSNNLETVQALLEAGANPRTKDVKGRSSRYHSVKRDCDPQIIQAIKAKYIKS